MGNELFFIDCVSGFKDGATVGQVQKCHPSFTVGQVGRYLKHLTDAGWVYVTVEPYGRTGKKVYRITEFCAMVCAGVARNYAGA